MPFSYSYLILNVFLVITKSFGSLAVKVSINQNITGLLGNNDTPLTCSFIKEEGEQISSVHIIATNKTDDLNAIKPIVIFIPDKPAKLLSLGYYLNGRVTLTNITDASTNATLTFHQLKCEDEKDYICRCFFRDVEHIDSSQKSSPTRISVLATSSKPDIISRIIVLSPKRETQGYSSSMSLGSKKRDIVTVRTSSNDTVTTTHLQSTDILPFVFREGDTVMFTCTGNIGYPPGKLIWQKTFQHENEPITYSNETTDIEQIPGKCSFKGTSHLTIQIQINDIQTKIRCFEESQINVPGMYLETRSIDVYFQVKHVDINKQPNLKHYCSNTDNIILTCIGYENPEPKYTWYKEGKNESILSRKSLYIIENVKGNNSGVYICEVYNIVDDVAYRKSNSVEIVIVHVDRLPSSSDSALLTIFIVYVIPVICVVIFIVTCVAVNKRRCIRPKRIDALQTGYLPCIKVTGITSVQDPNNYDDLIASDQTVVYDEINQRMTMKYELSKARIAVPTDNVDPNDVTIKSAVNVGLTNTIKINAYSARQ